MRLKTARRFLARNSWNIAKFNAGVMKFSPSKTKRIKEATRVVVKGAK